MINNKTWISKNKNWKIEIDDSRLLLSNLKTGVSQYPIIYDNYHIGYDEIVPAYVRAAVQNCACGVCIWNRYIDHTSLIWPGGARYRINEGQQGAFHDYINSNSGDMRGYCTAYNHILYNYDVKEAREIR